MNIKKQIFRKRKREGKIRYMILRASHPRNQACDIGDFVMAMMGNGLVMGGRDGYGGLSRIQRERLGEAERNGWLQTFRGFCLRDTWLLIRIGFIISIWWKKKFIIIYVNIANVENCGSFRGFGYIPVRCTGQLVK